MNLEQRPYDAFEHWCGSLFKSGRDLVPVFTIYCDDSGTHPESRVAAVGGYVGQVVEWKRFAREWSKALRKNHIDVMHRTDLEGFKGEFLESKGWNPDKRKDLLQVLHPIIKERTEVAIGAAVLTEDFRDVIPEPTQRFFGGVYGWCAHICMIHLREWTNVKKYRQLQAADTVVYEMHKHVHNQIVEHGKRQLRLSAADLIRETDKRYMRYWDRRKLKEWLATWDSKRITFEK